MQNSKWKTKWGTLGIAVVALASSLAPSKAQAQENFAWITNTNGVTWKEQINSFGQLYFGIETEEPIIAEIVVPEHAIISDIFVSRAVNLTNIVILTHRITGHSGIRMHSGRKPGGATHQSKRI